MVLFADVGKICGFNIEFKMLHNQLKVPCRDFHTCPLFIIQISVISYLPFLFHWDIHHNREAKDSQKVALYGL